MATATDVTTLDRPIPFVEGVEHRFVETTGLRIHVAEAGSADAPPLLMMHGWPQHFYMWRNQIPALSQEFRLIMPDLRGFGWSDATRGGYDKETFASDAINLLDALELDRVKLLAHDWGGWAGFLMCLRAPQRVERYMALNIPPPWGTLSLKKVTGSWRFWYQWVNASPWLGAKGVQPGGKMIETLFDRAAKRPGTWDKIARDSFIDQFSDPARVHASQLVYRTFVTREFFQVAGGRYNNTRMKVPTKLLFGTDDFAIPEAMLEGDHARYADDFTIEKVPGVGHFIAEEQPELVTNRALEYLAA